MIAKSQRWQKTALAAAAIAFMGLCADSAMALSLGRITVQSALGEPLRAEIDIPEINAEEAATLKVGVAHPDAFVAAGLEYNPALSSLQASVQRRADGRAYVRLTSARPVNDPFVDMILEASWSSGRIIRDFTMLFDPPVVRQQAPAPTLPQASAAPVPVSRPTAAAPAAAAQPAPTTKSVTAPTVPAGKATTKPASDSGKTVTVHDGDTAGKIAANAKPAGISLDQMLVAMLRANPDAFLKGNINRIRSGAVISLPTEEQARAVSPSEASELVVAQSKDFNDFRRNLATSVPTASVVTADRKSSGTVTAKVEDKKPAAATPDKLTLSKGSVQAKANEEKIAKERAEKEAAARAAELAKNIKELSKVAAATKPVASAPVAAAAPAASTVKAAASSPAPTMAVAAVTPPVIAPTASAPTPPAPVASAPASAPAPVKPAAAAPAPAPTEEPGILDELLSDPLVPAAGGGLLVLLGGFAFWRQRQRKKNAAQVDSSFLESRLQPDSFFGASGGQRIDTANEGPVSNSSMVYSASQLDAADDVDPVAEADVYLAYGRDLQAEEILKEAVRTNPNRLAIHTKLLEIYAKRRDAKGFESAATHAFKLTGGSSPEWARICEMGLSIDPDNKLYQPGITSVSGFGDLSPTPGSEPTVAFKAGAAFANSTVPQPAQADFTESKAVDLDLDLDFSLDEEPASAISDVTGGKVPPTPPTEQTHKMAPAPAADEGMSLDFDVSGPGALSAIPEPAAALPEISLSMDGLSMSNDDMLSRPDFAATDTAPPDTGRTNLSADSTSSGMLEFDMGSLSLDLEGPSSEQPSEAPTLSGDDPLETKLALAEEFISIGDEDGARALIEEVVAEATGDMRAKAQRALANLS